MSVQSAMNVAVLVRKIGYVVAQTNSMVAHLVLSTFPTCVPLFLCMMILGLAVDPVNLSFQLPCIIVSCIDPALCPPPLVLITMQ